MLLEFFKGIHGLIKMAETASAVSWKLANPLPQSHLDRRIRFRGHWNRRIFFFGLIDTAESASAVSLKPPNLLLHLRPIWTAEADHSKWTTRISRRIWSHMRNGFSPWIRALGFDEKNRGSKISWHCPFKVSCFHYWCCHLFPTEHIDGLFDITNSAFLPKSRTPIFIINAAQKRIKTPI
jgi:hypothetical protein